MRYLILICCLSFTLSGHAAQCVPQIPQIPAFLPMANTVPMGAPAPIDGEWMINTIGKRIRIQGGRAYALDPWVHMFVLQVKPMMIEISVIATSDGQNYVGKDLPLLGTWNATLGSDGMLNATVQTMVGPVRYGLMPVRIDNQQAYDLAKSGRGQPSERERSEYDRDPRDDEPAYGETPPEDDFDQDDTDENDWDEWD